MGQVRKRGGVWWIRYYTSTGTRKEESARTDCQDVAQALLKLREAEVALHQLETIVADARQRLQHVAASRGGS